MYEHVCSSTDLPVGANASIPHRWRGLCGSGEVASETESNMIETEYFAQHLGSKYIKWERTNLGAISLQQHQNCCNIRTCQHTLFTLNTTIVTVTSKNRPRSVCCDSISFDLFRFDRVGMYFYLHTYSPAWRRYTWLNLEMCIMRSRLLFTKWAKS